MKKALLFAVVLLSFSFRMADMELTAAERKSALDILKESKENFLKSVKGLRPDQLNYKATPSSWSIAECSEHIAKAENNIWSMLDGALKQPADPSRRSEVKATDDGLVKNITDRTNKFKTSEPFEPTNAFGGFEGSVKEFTTKRDAHIAFVKKTKDDLRDRYATLPFGTLDGYQVVIFMAAHTKRHTAQIEEVKADAGYPK